MLCPRAAEKDSEARSNAVQKSQRSAEVELVQVEVTDRLADRCVFGFLHSFFELFGENVFFVRFLEPRIAEFVFALAILFSQDTRGVGEINSWARFGGSLMRQDHPESRIYCELCMAARAIYLKCAIGFLRHNRILRLFFFGEKWTGLTERKG